MIPDVGVRSALAVAWLIVASAAAWPASAQSDTRYVSDVFEVNLRTGPSNEHAILRLLPSGASLEALETDAATGYTRVRTRGGIEGWVLSRYLMAEPAARQQIEALRARVLAAESEAGQQAEARGQAEATRDEAAQRAGSLEQENERLAAELDQVRKAAADVLAIDERNRALQQRIAEMDGDLAAVRRENDALTDGSKRDWFLAGAGAVGLGVVLGLVLPRIRLRRKSGWGRY